MARRILELRRDGFLIFDKKTGYRPMQYRDIVILMLLTKRGRANFYRGAAKLRYPRVFRRWRRVFCDRGGRAGSIAAVRH